MGVSERAVGLRPLADEGESRRPQGVRNPSSKGYSSMVSRIRSTLFSDPSQTLIIVSLPPIFSYRGASPFERVSATRSAVGEGEPDLAELALDLTTRLPRRRDALDS